MKSSDSFKKSFSLTSSQAYSCQLELDRQDQSLYVYEGTEVVSSYQRGGVLQTLLKEEKEALSLKHFFLYQLDLEESVETKSLSVPAPSICRCFFVTEEMAQDHFSKGSSPLSVSESTGAGSLCGKCLPDLCRIFYHDQNTWKFDQQKVRPKRATPAEIVLYVGEAFSQISIESFFENCLYYRAHNLEFNEKMIKEAVWEKFRERIVPIAL